MINFLRPMLACPLLPPDVEHSDENILAAMQKLRYPVLASLKKDGIRALRLNGSLLSRTLKPIPNKSIRQRSLVLPGGFDMELWNPELTYDQIESIVMSREHPDSEKIQFHVLDWFGCGQERYYDRCIMLQQWSQSNPNPQVKWFGAFGCDNAEILESMFHLAERENGEGICFRTPNSPYKQGRSTLKEQYLVKLCRYTREEVTIVGFTEQMENGNAQTTNAVGLSERSDHQANMFGKNTLGSLICRRDNGDEVRVGTGFTDRLRWNIWSRQIEYLGQRITIKYKGHGIKNKLRSPVFVGFRREGF